MKARGWHIVWLAGAACFFAFAARVSANKDTPEAPSPADKAAMMEKAKKFTQPGKQHEVLKRFIGKWDMQTRVTMPGQEMPAEKGQAEFGWLMEGRWLKSEMSGTMMGQPIKSFMIMGYDNFKQSFVTTHVSTMDTAMLHSEGDLTRTGDVLVTYGTLDEYLTGEHDKMVKYVWRFVSNDKIVFEIHDLPIGEDNTKVIEVTFTRQS